MIRVSRPCYDKYHRCPGWAGGGMKYAKVQRCDGGSLASYGGAYYHADGRPRGRRWRKWRFNRCPKCRVIISPYVAHWLDWTYWQFRISRWYDNRAYERTLKPKGGKR